MSTEEVVVKFYDAICEYGRPGRLGKTFQTKNNYYFLDAGTGKVAQIRKSVYDILTTLLESDDVTELLHSTYLIPKLKDNHSISREMPAQIAA